MELIWKLNKRSRSFICFVLVIIVCVLVYVFQNSKLSVSYLSEYKMSNKSMPVQKARSESVSIVEVVTRTPDPHTDETTSTEHMLRSIYLNKSMIPMNQLNLTSTGNSRTNRTTLPTYLEVSSMNITVSANYSDSEHRRPNSASAITQTTELIPSSSDSSIVKNRYVGMNNSVTAIVNYTVQSTTVNRTLLLVQESSSDSSPKPTTTLVSVSNQTTKVTITTSQTLNVSIQHTLRSVMFTTLKGVTSSFANNSSSNNDTKMHYFKCPGPIGRLGNMMFQFSGTSGIAHTLGYKLFIEPSHPLNKFFDINQTLDINLTNVMSFNEDQCKRRIWITNKEYMSHNLTTWGYLQAWTYFENNTKEVRKAFTIKKNFLNEAKNFLNSKTKGGVVLVGIHIRRGDLTSDWNQGLGYTIADGNYTRKAMEWHRRKTINVRFVVASDDMKWCKEHIKGDDVIYSEFSEPIIDLALLSLCHHCIITGGSFGWWGAWLAGGTVIYLRDFPRPGSWLDNAMHKRKEYYPPHWIVSIDMSISNHPRVFKLTAGEIFDPSGLTKAGNFTKCVLKEKFWFRIMKSPKKNTLDDDNAIKYTSADNFIQDGGDAHYGINPSKVFLFRTEKIHDLDYSSDTLGPAKCVQIKTLG